MGKVTKRTQARKAKPAPRAYAKPARKAFIFFSQHHRRFIQQSLGLSWGTQAEKSEVCHAVSDAWKFMTAEQRAPFQEVARLDKLRYDKERETLPDRDEKAKAATGPRKNAGAYWCFQKENRARVKAANAGLDGIAISKVLAQEWKAMSDEAKAAYQEMAKADLERYRVECIAWKEASPSVQVSRRGRLVLKSTPKEKVNSKPKSTKPKRNANAFILFQCENKDAIKAEQVAAGQCGSASALAKMASALWKQLPEDQRKKYADLAKADLERYERETKAWRIGEDTLLMED